VSTALYRRYRPETFADVIGQAHVTEPLTQALRNGRVHHAYLFSGPRGCGKTTSARIMARCLNCEQGPTPEPCGTCESCVALARSGPGTVDVIEIDAASHGGVEDARDLRERAAFGPAQSRYKVYIIDEAHMVTTHGFNALLKVVEEPPEHVKFVFATTEPEKVLSTIRSRTHHYPFHLVPPQRLATYLEQVCRAEGTSLEPGVLSFVTRAGGGSVRDSLSVLDQLIAGAGEEGLTYERTAALLGFTDTELLDAVVDAVAAADAASVFTQVNKVMESGQDPRRFVEDLLERYRDLIVVAAVGERTGGLLRGLPEDQVARLRQQSSVSGHATLTRAADVVSRGLSEMTGAVSYRMHLELICARLLLPGAAGEQGYAARLDRIERRLAAGGSGAGPSSQPSQEDARPSPAPSGSAPADSPRSGAPVDSPRSGAQADSSRPGAPADPSRPGAPADSPRSATSADSVPASPPAVGALDTDAVRRAWPEVLDKVKEMRRVTWTLVSVNCRVLDYDGRRLLLGIDTPGLATRFRESHHGEVVRQALIESIGLDTQVEGVPVDEPGPQAGRAARDGESTAGGGLSSAEQLGVTNGAAQPDRPDWSHRGRAPSWAGPGEEAVSDPADRSAAGSGEDPPQGSPARAAQAARTTSEGEPSHDDEDLDSSGTVGQPVVESVLGGTVLSVDDDQSR